ncbi:MAG: exodeoxyribonuclease VII large subunit, partial [Rikenellaceae bacterium]
EALRWATIEKLAADGDLERNKALGFPLLPQRIAVVSSRGAAGYGDFMDELTKNEFGYLYLVDLFHTTMQGTEAESSVIASLDAIYSVADKYDCIVIIRGGGSSSDLSCFDSYNIARKVAISPLPVITGIGHDRDQSITDMTSAVSIKTPTAVARFFIDKFCDIDNELDEKKEYVKELFDEQCRILHDQITSSSHTLRQVVNQMVKNGEIYFGLKQQKLKDTISKYFISANSSLTVHEEFLEQISDLKIVKNRTFIASLYNAIKVKSHTLLTNSRNKLVLQGSQTDSFDPSHIFALGYTLAKIQGKILRNAEQVVVGDDINVVLIDAEVKANVTQIIKNKK